ncbi:homeodomain protein, partial [Volvox carteri f. nagariensis]
MLPQAQQQQQQHPHLLSQPLPYVPQQQHQQPQQQFQTLQQQQQQQQQQQHSQPQDLHLSGSFVRQSVRRDELPDGGSIFSSSFPMGPYQRTASEGVVARMPAEGPPGPPPLYYGNPLRPPAPASELRTHHGAVWDYGAAGAVGGQTRTVAGGTAQMAQQPLGGLGRGMHQLPPAAAMAVAERQPSGAQQAVPLPFSLDAADMAAMPDPNEMYDHSYGSPAQSSGIDGEQYGGRWSTGGVATVSGGDAGGALTYPGRQQPYDGYGDHASSPMASRGPDVYGVSHFPGEPADSAQQRVGSENIMQPFAFGGASTSSGGGGGGGGGSNWTTLQGRVAAGALAYGTSVAAPSRMINGRGLGIKSSSGGGGGGHGGGCGGGGGASGPGSKKGRENLPRAAVQSLKLWVFNHIVHPYPSEDEKEVLCANTGLDLLQLNNWFINARVRIWKPLITEVFMSNQPRMAHEAQVRGDTELLAKMNAARNSPTAQLALVAADAISLSCLEQAAQRKASE